MGGHSPHVHVDTNVIICMCTIQVYTVEDQKTFPFDVLQNGTVSIVVRCVLRNGIKTLQKRYALKTVVERLYYCCGTIYSRVAFVGVATCTRTRNV